MTVDCLRCRYCDGRQGDVQRWGLLKFGVLCRGGEFIYSLGQIGKVRAEVFQVYPHAVQDITVTPQEVVKQFEKSVIAYLRSVYKVYQLPHKEKSTGMA